MTISCADTNGAVKWGPLERGDILDRKRLDQVFECHKPRVVTHFAAFAAVGESVADPGKYYRNNVAGSLTLLEAMRDNEVDRIVFSSTCATYGVPETIPIHEDTPQEPINLYGASKLMVKRMMRDFAIAHGLNGIVLRYFNAAGADLDNEIGQAHDPASHLIPLVLDAATGRRANVTVFGDDYDTPDGTCIRDYIHVTDLADAHVKAIEALNRGAGFGAYNLGIGQGSSVREVVEAARKVTGLPIPAVIGARRAGDPAVLISDAAKARAELGWQPQITDLARIVRTAWAWHQKHMPARLGRAPRQAATVHR